MIGTNDKRKSIFQTSFRSILTALDDVLSFELCRICRGYCKWINENNPAVSCNTKTVCNVCWQLLSTQQPSADWCEIADSNVFKVASGARYKGHVKKLVHHLKYDSDRLIANDLAILLRSAWSMIEKDVASDAVIFVPVPLHRKRLHSRGYNQAELMAKALARDLNLEVDATDLDLKVDAKALYRVKPTIAQHGLGRLERQANLSGAFRCDAKRVDGKTIILIDDVLTSGSTLSEAARTLLQNGATKVFGLTAARAMLRNAIQET